MPFELGIFFGAKKFGDIKQRRKTALVLEYQKYLYQQYISDLNGIDTNAHDNNPEKVIKIIRDWLYSSSGKKVIDGHLIINKDYKSFSDKLPKIAAETGLDINDLHFNDYCYIVEISLMPYMK